MLVYIDDREDEEFHDNYGYDYGGEEEESNSDNISEEDSESYLEKVVFLFNS